MLRALGLGDLLTGVPALRGLRRAFPDYELVLAAPEQLREVAAEIDAVDSLLPADAPDRGVPSLLHWSKPAPAVAVDLHGNGPESRLALAELRPWRLLASTDPQLTADPPWRAEDHERVRWCRLLAAYRIAADPDDVRLPRPERSPAPGAVVVHPGANAPARRWPVERYAEVVRGLLAALPGRPVVLSGGPGEEPLVRELAGLLPPLPVYCGLPFREFAGLVGQASLLIGTDSGPAHLAVAYGTPSVTLFGPVAPEIWGPPPNGPHRVVYHPGPPGDANGAVPDPCLLDIGADEVLKEALKAAEGAR
nr:glycosyltransferase family 9 protein [Phaeacidiphilus oryzae]